MLADTVVKQMASPQDEEWLRQLWLREWNGETMVTCGQTYHLQQLEALIAWRGDTRVGALTYYEGGHAYELMSLNALQQGLGIGGQLMWALEHLAFAHGVSRLWLVTTNDNLDALRFYQRRGFRLIRIDSGAVDRAREIKPEIPKEGNFGIPIHDELILEKSMVIY
jgi:ribosomal protein S18 acetylase RimI-like enzyme